MLAIRHVRWPSAGVAAATLALLAACNSDKTTAPANQTPALSTAEASSLGEAVTADAQSELEGVTASGGVALPGMATAPFGSAPTTCVPTISPSPVVDTDGDRVPDSVRITFPGCGFSEWSESDTIRGSIDVVDPTPTIADRDLRLRFLDFARIEVFDGRKRSIALNGTRQVLRDASMIGLSDSNFQATYTFPDGTTATSDRNWLSTFTADVAGSIAPDAPLPSGTLNIKGTSTWTHEMRTFALSVVTSPALHYNASCTVRPRVDAGTLTVTVTRNGATSTVTVTFTACGQFTVTRS